MDKDMQEIKEKLISMEKWFQSMNNRLASLKEKMDRLERLSKEEKSSNRD